MAKDRILYLNDSTKNTDRYNIEKSFGATGIASELKFFDDSTGEQIWTPLHNRTVIAGSALVAQKLFSLDRNTFDNTPTYDTVMGLDNGADGSTYPSISIKDNDGNVVASVPDETQRVICGFCLGQGGAGLETSDVFDVKYCSWITPDNMVPFRYPIQASDDVDEDMYKGKKALTLPNGQLRNAYYFKRFSNTPICVQNYTTSIGTFSDTISPASVYSNIASADKGQTYVELHLKITMDDCREFFIAHKGLENAKINQISLVYAWSKEVEVTKLDEDGNTLTKKVEYFQDIRPFSLINIPSEILSDPEKSISCIYTLFF